MPWNYTNTTYVSYNKCDIFTSMMYKNIIDEGICFIILLGWPMKRGKSNGQQTFFSPFFPIFSTVIFIWRDFNIFPYYFFVFELLKWTTINRCVRLEMENYTEFLRLFLLDFLPFFFSLFSFSSFWHARVSFVYCSVALGLYCIQFEELCQQLCLNKILYNLFLRIIVVCAISGGWYLYVRNIANQKGYWGDWWTICGAFSCSRSFFLLN